MTRCLSGTAPQTLESLSPEERLTVDMALSGIDGFLYSAFWRMQEAYGLGTALKRFRGLIDDTHWPKLSKFVTPAPEPTSVRRERAIGWPPPWERAIPDWFRSEERKRTRQDEADLVRDVARKFFREAVFTGHNPLWMSPGKRKLVLLELADSGAIKGKTRKGAKPRLFGALFHKAAFGPDDVRTAVEILPQVDRTEVDGDTLRVHAKEGSDVELLVEQIRRIPGIRLMPVEVLEGGDGEPEIYRSADYPRDFTPFGGPGMGRLPNYYPLQDYVTPSIQGPPDVQMYRQDRPHEPGRTR